MKQEIRRFKRAILIVALLLGVDLGAGAALLTFNLTKDLSPRTLGGLICLVLSVALAILFGILVHLRASAVARYEQMESLFGKGSDILSQEEFMSVINRVNKHGRRYESVYCLHMRLGKGASDLDVRFARLSLADLLFDLMHTEALIGYTGEADFILALEKEENLSSALAEIDRHLRRNPKIVPYGLYVGKAPLGKKPEESIEMAVQAAYEDTLVRPSLDIRTFGQGASGKAHSIDIRTEMEAKRLRIKAIHLTKGDQNLYYVSPELYDPVKGALKGKDFRNAMMLANQNTELENLCLQYAYSQIQFGEIPGPFGIEISAESLKNPDFLLRFASDMIERGIKTKKIIFFLPAPALEDPEVKLTVKKLVGLRIRLGVYEFGEEKLKSIELVNPAFLRFKTEYTRASSSAPLLNGLIDAGIALGAEPLLLSADLLHERSAYVEGETLILDETKPEVEEEEEEGKEEEVA